MFFFFFGCILWFWTLSYWYKDFSLNGDLKEDVYIEKPKGFIPKWDENWVCTSENYMGWKNLAYMWRKFLLFLIFLHHMWIYSFSGNWYWDACCSQTMAIQILKRMTSMKHHIYWALKLNKTRWIKILVSPKKNISTRKILYG